MHTAIEEQVELEAAAEKDVRWEALRLSVNTLGARNALDKAMGFKGGNILFEYLWFLFAVLAAVAALKAMSWADRDMRGVPPERASTQQP